MTPSSSKKQPFEQRLAALETLVDALEAGELSLEEGVEQYGQGVKMLQDLQKSLSAAEQKVEKLTSVLKQSLEVIEDDDLEDTSAE